MSLLTERKSTTIGSTPTFDTARFRSALGRFASGVTVVTAQHEEQPHGMTANAFVSVPLDPPLVLVSLGNRSNMHRILPGIGRYGVTVLAEDQEALSNLFAGRAVDGVRIPFIMRDGVPLLDGGVAHFVVQVIDAHPACDHTLYIGHVEYFEWRDDKPLLFYSGQYQRLRVEGPKSSQWPEGEFSLFSIGSSPSIT
jgi:flavin reductase (DIM6/NTAB) family NADH-FMN oxidoreductase RutF